MREKYFAAVVTAVVACIAGNTTSATPLEAYGQLPTLSDVALSPDGTTVAYVSTGPGKRFIVVQRIAEKQPLAVLGLGESKFRALQWADDSHLLITASMTTLPMGLVGQRQEYSTAQVYDLETKETRSLLGHTGFDINQPLTMNVIEGALQPRVVDGRSIVFVPGIYFYNNSGRYALFAEDLKNHSTRTVSNLDDTHGQDWVVDGGGDIVAQADYYESQKHWKLKIFHNGDASTPVDAAAEIEGPDIEGLTEDGTGIIIRLPQTEDWPSFEKISLADGRVEPWSYADLHLRGLFTDVNTGKIIGGSQATDQSDYVFFDPHADHVWRSIKAAFQKATNVELESWSNDWTKAIVRVFGAAYGDGYFYVDMTSHKADPIAPAYDGIDDVSPVKWIEYTAQDGRPIHAYLTLPLNREAKNLPLVVLPHGGPHSRDYPGFDWISQALASRGYAVLQPQFRGSAGFGKDLLWAGFGEFGRKMQTDLSDGVSALAAQGVIDPKRVCIVGASYGGYAALAGATLQTGVYRCAVSIAGISDMREQLSFDFSPQDGSDDRGERFWDRFLGVTDRHDPKLDSISPIKFVDRVSIPILLIHGKDDTVVPISQSSEMADALRRAGKQVEFVELEGEDHWLSTGKTRLQMLEATVKFLEANNPPGAPGAAAN
jgi:dipeptidyl aminopeptidase/acylaminoacyl peptidase